jgi:hypothetical protein
MMIAAAMAGFSSVTASDMRASQRFENGRVDAALWNELGQVRDGYPCHARVLYDGAIPRLSGEIFAVEIPPGFC